MHPELMEKVNAFIRQKEIPLLGAADAATLNRLAPEGFRPMDLLPNAKSALVLARPLPASVFRAPRHNRHYSSYTGSFHTYSHAMNDAVAAICVMLEAAGYASLPIPSYSPLAYHNGEPRGIASLKHFAVQAGLGKMGKNTLLIHPHYGTTLRLGGLLTEMAWPASGPADLPRICPEKCDICLKACPVGALSEKGIDITRCMCNCIEHLLLPPFMLMRPLRWLTAHSRFMTQLMEQLTMSLFEMYSVSCFKCLERCPHFPRHKTAKAEA
ncbi:MAG: hypothetical protein M0036_03170 [Desulfobacteraceae bacterium]|nr:hypothetical protein [Desulfobacteraceae bacterium]